MVGTDNVMWRWVFLLSLTATVATAGCAGLLGGDADSPTTGGDVSRSSPTPAVETGPNNDGSMTATIPPGAKPNVPSLVDRNDTGQALVSLSELPTAYNLSGERYVDRETAAERVSDRLAQEGINIQHERSFQLSDSRSDFPSLVLFSVTIYDSPEAAAAGLDQFLDVAVPPNGTTSRFTVLSNVQATELTYETDSLSNRLLIGRSGPVRYYVVVSDREVPSSSFARELFVELVADTLERD